MILLVDLGNTRLKLAARTPDGGIRALGEARYADCGIDEALARALDGGEPGQFASALCANVAGEAAGQALTGALQQRGVGPPEFLRARPEAFGVRCAYPEPLRLGADRWAALLGARGMTAGACLVVDAGSALTIDAMGPRGRHLGGWILPGLAMMVGALELRTGDLAARRRASEAPAGDAFPTDSGPAMEQGARLAATGAIWSARARLEERGGGAVRVLLTGGDAESLLGAVDGAERVPDLVFRGLARAAGGPEGTGSA